MLAHACSPPYELDDDPARVDRDLLCRFLTTQAYWGRWRDRETITGQLDAAWRIVAAYDGPGGPMVGFARATSDGFAVAYLADVFVVPGHRGHGLGHALVEAMTDTGPGQRFRWMLHTADAHGLYAAHGFRAADGTVLERPSPFTGPPAADADGDGVPADSGWLADTRQSYDTVAPHYTEHLPDLPGARSFEHAMLTLLADRIRRIGGPIVDLGCGPGRLTAHLDHLGVDAFGIDLSPGMIEVARRDHPGLRFEVGSMTDPDLPDASVGGALLWFSLIHVPDAHVPEVLAHVHRALRPGGVALIGFHLGQGTVLKTEGYGGHPMRVLLHRRRLDQIADWSQRAGLVVDTRITHEPAPGVAGGVVLAHRPEDGGSPPA